MEVIFYVLVSALVVLAVVQGFQAQIKSEAENKARLEKTAVERAAEIERKTAFLKARIKNIKKAQLEFHSLISLNNGYFSNYHVQNWLSAYSSLYNAIKDIPYIKLSLTVNEQATIKHFRNYFENAESERSEFNNRFLNNELKDYEEFFNNIEGRQLDIQQRTAIICDDDNNLVIAGAGSGKTTTIVGKVKYIIDRYKVDPSEILLISFTRKSASDLSKRINEKGIDVNTFHGYGRDVIAETEGKKPSVYDSDQLTNFVKNAFDTLIQNENYINKVTDYFTDHLKPIVPADIFKNRGEYIQYLKDKNFRPYQQITRKINGKETINREIVKSIEECKIANFLLFNGLNYAYEMPYEHETKTKDYSQYKPDFVISSNGKRVYLEHFALNKNGQVPAFFAKVDEGETQLGATNRYVEGIGWKRLTHKSFGTTLIESFSHEMTDGTLFDNLRTNLTNAGITLHPKSPQEIWDIIKTAAVDETSEIITLFKTFIVLMKSNNINFQQLHQKNLGQGQEYIKRRNIAFLELVSPIYQKYQDHLSQREEIDFSDMINIATSKVKSQEFTKKYKYIIIDEFQDISSGRYGLIKAFKDNYPEIKLFCVGDDWQSIYRFTGSDIALFKDFENYFGFTINSKIETTYRFKNPLINLSSQFILKNPNQVTKSLRSNNSQTQTVYKILYSDGVDNDDSVTLKKIFDELLTQHPNLDSKSIIILGRYTFDIRRIVNENNYCKYDENSDEITYSNSSLSNTIVKAHFYTAHKSKGIEADIVIIINCNAGKHGFPSEISDDLVLNLLLSEADQFPNGEERRLFYVAMTRAKEQVYFISNRYFISKFIRELELESGVDEKIKCPNCVTADVVERRRGYSVNGDLYIFSSCTNFAYGCTYKLTEWPNDN